MFLDRRRMSQCFRHCTRHDSSTGLPCRPVLHRVRTTTLSPALQQPDCPIHSPHVHCLPHALGTVPGAHLPGDGESGTSQARSRTRLPASKTRPLRAADSSDGAHVTEDHGHPRLALGSGAGHGTAHGRRRRRRAGRPSWAGPSQAASASKQTGKCPSRGTRHSAAAERGAGRWPLCEACQGQSLFRALTTRPSCSRGKTEESRGARRIKPTTRQSHRQGLRRCREESAFRLGSGFWASSRPHLCPGSL